MKRFLIALPVSIIMSFGVALSAFAADHKVSIKGFKFAPAELTVAVGDTVTFTNDDGAPHTATGGDFDTGRLSKGDSKTITISAAGTTDYICSFHPAMKGKIMAN